MTKDEAVIEVERSWGLRAAIYWMPSSQQPSRHVVYNGGRFLGAGDSFGAAIADAKAREVSR